MDNALDRDMATLANTHAGFVGRRDAARRLGDGARRAWRALEEHRDDRDTYVRTAVESALTGAPEGVTGETVPAASSSPDETVRALAEACGNGAPPEARGEGYVVTWSLQGGRKQRVYLTPYTGKDGRALIRVFTYCGAATAEAKDWVLRSNAKLVRCAFALHKRKGRDYLILVHNLVADEATRAVARKTVEEIASHGDWLESKLSGMDEF